MPGVADGIFRGQFFLFSACLSDQPCQNRIVFGTTKKQNNQVWVQLGKYFGDYFLQHQTINGRLYYKSASEHGKYAIWYYHKFGRKAKWIIGLNKHRGLNQGHFFVISRAKCPYQTRFAWKYYNKNQRWEPAYEDFTIWCDPYLVQSHIP